MQFKLFFLFSFSLSLFLLLLLSALCSSWSRVACAAATLETRLGDKVSPYRGGGL